MYIYIYIYMVRTAPGTATFVVPSLPYTCVPAYVRACIRARVCVCAHAPPSTPPVANQSARLALIDLFLTSRAGL